MHLPKIELHFAPGTEEPIVAVLPPGEHVIGRAPECDIIVTDPLVAERHARLTVGDEEFFLEDLGHAIGTFVAGQRISGVMKLWPGQPVRLGATTFTLRRRLEPAPDETLPPAARELHRLLPQDLVHGGRYELGWMVARGGMGAIFDAREAATGRQVAMKVMLRQRSGEEVRRFVEEAQLTAQLEHPNIVPVHELGVDEHGQAFYTMKFVRGSTLAAVLGKLKKGDEETIRQFPLRRLLDIFMRVCDAVAFAHSKGVIHRDLKPDNIMIGDYGEVLVMDWGLAKILRELSSERPSGVSLPAHAESGGTYYTLAGTIAGTPSFMAPEQAEGRIDQIDARSDVFALGAILYSLLALEPPCAGRTIAEIMDTLRAGALVPPALRTASRVRRLGHCAGGRIPPAISAVAVKALAWEPADRYQSAPDLQKEIFAFQSGFATAVERAGWWRQSVLLMGRHQGLTVAIAVALLIVASLTATYIARLRASEQRALASAQQAKLNEQRAIVNERQAKVSRDQAQRSANEEAIQRQRATLAAAQGDFELALARLERGDVGKARAIAHLCRALRVAPDHRPAAAALRLLLTQGRWFLRRTATDLDPSAEEDEPRERNGGRSLMTTAEGDGIMTNASGEVLQRFRHPGAQVLRLEWSPQYDRVATVASDATVQIWEADTGKQVGAPFQFPGEDVAVHFSADGKWLGGFPFNGAGQVWRIDSHLQASMDTGTVSDLRFSPTGAVLLTVGDEGAQLWNFERGQKVGGAVARAGFAEFSANGEFFLTGEEASVRVWRTENGAPVGEPLRHEGTPSRAFFLPGTFAPPDFLTHLLNQDRQALSVATVVENTIYLWDVWSGRPVGVPLQHSGGVNALKPDPKGTFIAVRRDNLPAEESRWIWELAAQEERQKQWPCSHLGKGARIFSPDGKKVLLCQSSFCQVASVSEDEDKSPLLLQAPASTPPAPARAATSGGSRKGSHRPSIESAEFSSDGRRIVTADYNGFGQIWDSANGQPVGARMQMSSVMRCARFSPDSSLVLTTCSDGTAQLWKAETGEPFGQPVSMGGNIWAGEFRPDGKFFLTRTDTAAQLWEVETRKAVNRPMTHRGGLNSAEFSPDGRSILTSGEDDLVRFWNGTTAEYQSDIDVPEHTSLARFSPDGSRFATASNFATADSHIETWDTETRARVGRPIHNEIGILDLRFSPDGGRLLVADNGGAARIWDIATGTPSTEPLRHDSPVAEAVFTPDGMAVITVDYQAKAHFWPLGFRNQAVPAWFTRFGEAIGGESFEESGAPEPVYVEPQEMIEDTGEPLGEGEFVRFARWFLQKSRRSDSLDPM